MLQDFAFRYTKSNTGITITDFKKDITEVEIPSRIDNLPIEDISQKTLRSRSDIRYFCLHIENNDYSILRHILSLTFQSLKIRIKQDSEEILLAFPGYISGSKEDTMARVIHLELEGAGYAYRECVRRREIDYRSYDACFEKTPGEALGIRAEVALCRLIYKRALTPEAEGMYRDFIEKNADEVLLHFTRTGEAELLGYLVNHFSITREARERALKILAKAGNPALTAILMDADAGEEEFFCL